jgi:hypothetical protein
MVKKILDKRGMTEQDWQDYRRTQKGLMEIAFYALA